MSRSGAVRVVVSSVLLDYTGDRREVEARGKTLRAVLADLDRQFPGLRFRIVDEQDRLRQHMNAFVRGKSTRDLDVALAPGDEVHILHALSGG